MCGGAGVRFPDLPCVVVVRHQQSNALLFVGPVAAVAADAVLWGKSVADDGFSAFLRLFDGDDDGARDIQCVRLCRVHVHGVVGAGLRSARGHGAIAENSDGGMKGNTREIYCI